MTLGFEETNRTCHCANPQTCFRTFYDRIIITV